MNTVSGIANSARSGWDRMVRPSMPFGHRAPTADIHPQPFKRTSVTNTSTSPAPHPSSSVTLSCSVPFNSELSGPKRDEVIYASPGAFDKWIQPEGSEDKPVYDLPVHVAHRDNLERLCDSIVRHTNGNVSYHIRSGLPKPVSGLPPRSKAWVTNVCLRGPYDLVSSARSAILNQTPISLRVSIIDIDETLVSHDLPDGSTAISTPFLTYLDDTAGITKADIFLLKAKPLDDSASINGNPDASNNEKLRLVIYGDMLTEEHAKIRMLIMIDQMRQLNVDTVKIDLTLHSLICGRARKNITNIESATNTTIYFPPPFPQIYGYRPQDAIRRPDDEIIITGRSKNQITDAKMRLANLVNATKAFGKDVAITDSKIDDILLGRLDKVRKIMEMNGSYVLFPQVGRKNGVVRVQGTDILNVERTVREVMALASQFYSATWLVQNQNDFSSFQDELFEGLGDICISSGAEVIFENNTFYVYGSDDSVKLAMHVISDTPFAKYQAALSVKVELANEHKEFVSGKKNGKINKIMSHSNVQIVFDGFNEYNFYIDIRGQHYDATRNGLELVEQEMPASISFHVPDQYHKRIIGIGGQHIQRIMKRYSVFVKFSNAMDRGAHGRDDDDIKVDNVICRTPTRNAQNLELVKQEIMDMVEKVDAEFVNETVAIDRLYQRAMIARMPEIEQLEKKWNCKITFPNPEEASNTVTISGPEYQIPQAVDELLGMVPETHEIVFSASENLKQYLHSPGFQEVVDIMHSQYCLDLRLQQNWQPPQDLADPECLNLSYTRNNAGGLKDAIDFLIAKLVAKGLDAETVRGAIPRPKSDSFEESLPFFESKLLHRTEPPMGTDSPTRSIFGENDAANSGFFSKFRKPGSMSSFTSLIDRRKTNGSNSPGSLFKHASSNASKASLASLESNSSYRNPWNDSGINLAEDDATPHANGIWPTTSGPPHSSHSTTNGKFPFGASPLGAPHMAGAGDTTPTSRYDPRASVDSGRPSTSHSFNNLGYPGPIGPSR
ncbi:hypothetical protein BLS_005302 [Venturia inaequalis]|uniref:K Homology domain-containing protein n=1 Tax=Venturia inaequalis TaxID=5025 RepID=A0A8H3UGK5_VENIN|nr:hypothetical protein EG328_007158 [Venturia inaequalis]KAE9969620.1 hypothetical protein BLS_005302 [Venturia inaequalis]RDI86212.1 hypothetical protein Vi05172_g3820 [Venturia inaequalis]